MEVLALIVAVGAVLAALAAHARCTTLNRRLAELDAEGRRRAANLSQEVQDSLGTERRLLAAMAGGARLTPEQVLEGRLWRDVGGQEARRLVEEGGARVLDVRTPDETRGGIIPGALLVPVDQLEARLSEVPRDGKALVVYCAMGSRSAFACELLSREGHDELFNLEGGVGAWPAPLERPKGA